MFSGSESYKISRSISMTSKLKSMFTRQAAQPSSSDVENTTESSAIMHEMKNMPTEYYSRRKNENVSGTNDTSVVLRRRNGIRRHNTSLGAIEDLLQCPICKNRLQSPRMMPCQHTFCQKCLEKRLDHSKGDNGGVVTCPLCNLAVSDRVPKLLPTNLYIESLLHLMEKPGEGWLRLATAKPAVTFAPLPNRTVDSDSSANAVKLSGLQSRCMTCSNPCNNDNKCKHCKQIFCGDCWILHADELKEQLGKIAEQLETASKEFDSRIDKFRTKVDELKLLIEKEIEAKIAELMHERDERINRLTYRAERGEESAREIKNRMTTIQDETNDQKNGLYDELTDGQAKVKVFMSIHRATIELMKLENSWNPELCDVDGATYNSKQSRNSLISKVNIDLFYRRKVFSPKVIVNREIVQRPSGLSHDPLRDHTFVACPGSRQIVVLDKKYKVFRRYQNTELMAPQGLAYAESTEELFVTDKWRHCIFAFNRKGEAVRQMCKKGQSESQLSCPEGLAWHSRKNRLYVADTGNDRIQILELDGTCCGYIGPTERQANSVTKSGKVVGIIVNHLNQPTDVAVTDDFVIIADCGNHKIKIFNLEGVLVHTIGGSGTLRRYFRSPEVVKVDSVGNIIVGDSGNARIQIFSIHGELLRVLGGQNSKSPKFGWISGLLVKNNFDILIADSKNNVLKLF